MSTAPIEIRYHSRSRVLELRFADGGRLAVPAGWLRAHAPAPEPGVPSASAEVGIARIAPLAADTVRLHFDDGHASAVCSFAELRALALCYRDAAGSGTAAGHATE